MKLEVLKSFMILFVHMLFPVRRRFWPGWTSFFSPWKSPSGATRPTSGHGSTKWIQSRYCTVRRHQDPTISWIHLVNLIRLWNSLKSIVHFKLSFHLHYNVTYLGCVKKLENSPKLRLMICPIILQWKWENMAAKVSRQTQIVVTLLCSVKYVFRRNKKNCFFFAGRKVKKVF